jgi:hypothetical protein
MLQSHHRLVPPCVLLGALLTLTPTAHAQPAPAASLSLSPTDPAPPDTPAPRAASATVAPWQSPDDPAAVAPRYRLAQPQLASVRCVRSDTATRVSMELLAGFGTGAVILGAMLVPLLASDGRGVRSEAALPTFLVGAAGILFLTPLAVYGVGSAYDADGSYGSALLGELLFGFIGATIGYELSSSPSCSSLRASLDAPSPHPHRTPRRGLLAPPTIAPHLAWPSLPERAASVGVTLTF